MTHSHSTTAIIIGAGLSGLAAATELRDRNIPVTILEASDRVADPWRARHPKLRLNIHRHFTRLPGHHEPRHPGTYLPRDAVVDYLSEYAAGLTSNIQFETRVRSVHRLEGGWQVETNKGTYSCAHLIVATGREKEPDMPVWPGIEDFGGKVIHAAYFEEPSSYNGKKVLVVGAGNSGSDVLNHLSRANPAQVWISVRNGPSILPTRIFGYPMHRMARLFSRTPRWALDPLMAGMQWMNFGNLRRHGLPRHRKGGGSRLLADGVTPALDDGFVKALKKGRFEAVGQTVGFSAYTVELADGRKIDPDVVICATGYKTGLEELFGHLGALDQRGYPLCPAGQQDSRNPGLWFTGYGVSFEGFFYAAGVSATRLATSISAQSSKQSGERGTPRAAQIDPLQSLTLKGTQP
ncbi:NAD(P)/FAD-dependent oxidoreductase [Ruegeria sp. EL01]|uniref:flavin-containing monooxygenase n=1 Tax=Ruegeria sp. EL01 TaxID=2107578 RepID=UPI000EA80DDE|nr:NAD(P)/FAD-dependent oxidoreductase [Ruegeria sp. EL01]